MASANLIIKPGGGTNRKSSHDADEGDHQEEDAVTVVTESVSNMSYSS